MSFTEVITKIKEELGLGQEEGFPEQKIPGPGCSQEDGLQPSCRI